MCLAIYQPVGVKIARDRLSNGWNNNSDGGGYAFIDELGDIQIRKYPTWNEFVSGYDRDHRANTKSPFIIHERFATHGTKDETNIHPFEIDEQTVMIHNGILYVNMKKDKRSDTRTFAEDYLAKLPHGWMDDPDMVDMVEGFIGSGNKLVILTNDPLAASSVYIINEKKGHWDKGAWWSNDGYKPRWESKKWTAYDRAYKQGSIIAATSAAKTSLVTVTHPPTEEPGSPIQKVSAGGLLTDWDDGWQDDWTDAEWAEYLDYPSLCWLCGENLHPATAPVCFRCEWCTEHSQEWWTCGHMNNMELVQEYVRYYTNLTDKDRDFHDEFVLEMTSEAAKTGHDPDAIAAIEAAIKRA